MPGGILNRTKDLKSAGFTGTMYPFGIYQNDYFTRISRNIDRDDSFNYIVAIRPYVISPQYLHMICSSLNQISPNRVFINFVSGWVYDQEKKFGGVMSDINDMSTNIERSNYMIDYAKEFKKISNNKFYISTTNEHIFKESSINDFSMIIPYSYYKTKKFNITNQKYIISLAPIIYDEHKKIPDNQDSAYFTKSDFLFFLNECKDNGVEGILFYEDYAGTEYENISNNIKDYINDSIAK